ncbi:unnamed protein product [Protopolystoma xenopodis]|uniref:Uncharacterized protein n=1 Tax=Protopolystoma xenopodis TaxID=117903 RepID=A0A448XR45_9PLAT|nr:unnamed protein product [Protopolystoma xenopodis]
MPPRRQSQVRRYPRRLGLAGLIDCESVYGCAGICSDYRIPTGGHKLAARGPSPAGLVAACPFLYMVEDVGILHHTVYPSTPPSCRTLAPQPPPSGRLKRVDCHPFRPFPLPTQPHEVVCCAVVTAERLIYSPVGNIGSAVYSQFICNCVPPPSDPRDDFSPQQAIATSNLEPGLLVPPIGLPFVYRVGVCIFIRYPSSGKSVAMANWLSHSASVAFGPEAALIPTRQ